MKAGCNQVLGSEFYWPCTFAYSVFQSSLFIIILLVSVGPIQERPEIQTFTCIPLSSVLQDLLDFLLYYQDSHLFTMTKVRTINSFHKLFQKQGYQLFNPGQENKFYRPRGLTAENQVIVSLRQCLAYSAFPVSLIQTQQAVLTVPQIQP